MTPPAIRLIVVDDHPLFRAGVVAMLAAEPRGTGFGNGRWVRNAFEAAVGQQAWRLREVEAPTVEQLRELLPADLLGEASP